MYTIYRILHCKSGPYLNVLNGYGEKPAMVLVATVRNMGGFRSLHMFSEPYFCFDRSLSLLI